MTAGSRMSATILSFPVSIVWGAGIDVLNLGNIYRFFYEVFSGTFFQKPWFLSANVS